MFKPFLTLLLGPVSFRRRNDNLSKLSICQDVLLVTFAA